MGLFSPFIYTNKKGQKFWLHVKIRGRGFLYYFSKDPTDAINSLPKEFTVKENPKTGMPFIKKKEGGFLERVLGNFGGKTKQTTEDSLRVALTT